MKNTNTMNRFPMFEKDEPYCKKVMSDTFSYLSTVMWDDVALSIEEVNNGFSDLNETIKNMNLELEGVIK